MTGSSLSASATGAAGGGRRAARRGKASAGKGTTSRSCRALRTAPRPVYLVDGLRTPQLKARGRPGPFAAADLAVAAGRALLRRQPFPPEALDQVILGCVMPSPDEANIARVVALRLGCGPGVPAWTVQRNCGSGLQAVDCAFREIQDGRASLVLAGGTEAMSRAPLLWREELVAWLADWRGARGAVARLRALGRLRPRHLAPVPGLLRGLTDPVVGLSMGQTAEELAHRFRIPREAQDRYALESHRRLARALDEGRLAEELEPLYTPDGRVLEADDGLRRDTSLERLAALPPVFDRPFGTVTAGNSAQVTDGAALLLLADEAAVARWGLPVLGRVVDTQWAGVPPEQMGLGPARAVPPLLARHGLGAADVDWWEINEAFAAQVLAVRAALEDPAWCREQLAGTGEGLVEGLEQAFGAPPLERLNVDGGGISLGHPVGASGARIVLHLAHVLRQRGGRRGVAALCIGGGQGGALLLERAG